VRLLLDENLPRAAVEILLREGHEVLWIRTHAPGMKDRDILHLAAAEERIVLTLDKDFRQLSLNTESPGKYGVILFRIHPAVPDKIIPIVLKTLYLKLNWIGHVSVVSETTVQVLPLRHISQ
jgi:predicted nuclease of predicted toxin-antitoxin system